MLQEETFLVISMLVSAPHPWAFLTLLPSGVVLVLGPNAALSFRTLARSGSPGLPILSGFSSFSLCSLAYLNVIYSVRCGAL